VDLRAENLAVDDGIDVGALAARLWAGRWWIVASVLFFTFVLTTLAFIMTPKCRVATVLVPAAPEHSGLGGALGGAIGSLGGLASLAGINVGGNTETEESLAVLRSQQFTEAFIQDLHLMPKLFAKRWDAATGSWKPGGPPPTVAQAFKYFDGAIRTISQDKKTGLVTVQIEWKNRDEAAEWANTLVQRLNEEMRARAIAKTDASLGFLEKELNSTSVVPTREAINRLIEAQIKQRMLANVTREYSFRVVDRAIAPDNGDTVKPKKLIMIVAGPFVGAIAGVFAVLALGWFWSGIIALKREADLAKHR
jgi:uncharacterized protein involved in exopolysaccharide biosynthesis